MKVRHLFTAAGRAALNQFEIIDTLTNRITFQSYDSEILTIDRDRHTLEIGPDWNYSNTTNKYRNQFLRRQGFDEIATTDTLRKAINAGYIGAYKIITT